MKQRRRAWAILRGVTASVKHLAAAAATLGLVMSAGPAVAGPDVISPTAYALRDLDVVANEILVTDVLTAPARRRGVLVPTPWGEVEATIVSTPVDRMLRVPLARSAEPGQDRVFQPYFTAGARKDVDADPALEQAKATTFADSGRTDLKAGAGLILRLDSNIELFGEYQFMRLHRPSDGRGAAGPLGTTLDAGGFSIGLSVRY